MKPLFAISLASLLFTGLAHALPAEEELLPPDEAFRLSTRVVDSDTLEARWEIADGYYLYRDKFKFEPLSDGLRLKPAVIPAGKKKQDPLFGEVETHTKSVVARLPLARGKTEAHTATLRIHAQGCNEPVGVCYPPMIKEVQFQLPAIAAAASLAFGNLQELSALAGGGQQEFLKPDEAFVLTLHSDDGKTLAANIFIAEGYYLYRDKTSFTLTTTSGDIRLGEYQLPKGKVKVDEFVGKTEVYYRQLDVKLPVSGSVPGTATMVLRASYQGCAENGICYPPIKKDFNLTWAEGSVVNVAANPMTPSVLQSLEDNTGGQTSTTAPRSVAGWVIVLAGAFGAGLLLTFTPCVLPMIPILSSVIVGQGDKKITKLKGGVLATSYVLGTSVTYTAAGILAGASGDQLQAYFQNAWALGGAAVLFSFLALSMFGFYDIQMPSFIQSRLQQRTQKIQGGSLVGVFFLGLVSALIIGACVSPILITALSGAILSQDPVLGGAIMFAMSLGMGVILIAIGVGAGYLLPKAGPWMDRVKQVFGILLLAVAIYLLGQLPQVPVLFLWAALLIITAVYLGATQTLPAGAGGWRFLWKGLGTLLLIWGFLALLGGLAGNRDILLPLSLTHIPTMAPEQAIAEPAHFETITSLAVLEQRLDEARTAGKPVIVDYFASWCADCIRMEKGTFADPEVASALERFVLLKPDVTDAYSAESKAMKQRFGVLGPPATLFFSADGEERRDLHFYGYLPPAEFLQKVNQT